MMMRIYPALLTILYVLVAFAQQTTDYVILDAPIGVKSADSLLWIKWTGKSRTGFISPDSGVIYFSKSPGGTDLSNYQDSITVFEADSFNNRYFPPSTSSDVPLRGIAFRASKQAKMGTGVFYSVVALKRNGNVYVSNEFQIIIESPKSVSIKSPSGTIQSLTPVFQWYANSGVPYYHVILSDDAIKVNSEDDGKIDLQGLSIVWQAITPNSQIVYGAPDPSGTITAEPPPLSPGKQYSWIVLNNYGNHLAFSSTRYDLPGYFKIEGVSLSKPISVYPKGGTYNSGSDSIIKFKWTNLDKNANTYKLYVYTTQEYEGIRAQIIVWQTEVMALNSAETMSVDVNAKSAFSTNDYSWRIIATDEKGAGTAGDTVGFRYEVPTGTLVIRTVEEVLNDGRIAKSNVGLVKMQVEVLDGTMEAPLFFYTDTDGYLSRERPVGTYRITAIKNEFESQTQTFSVGRDNTTNATFILTRPQATIYGKVIDEAGKGINIATIVGISDIGDTLSTQTDALGNYVFKCYGADWFINVQKTGYKTVLPEKVTVKSGENVKLNTITMSKNPVTLSGIVKNASGNPLLGVKVKLLFDGMQIDEIPATSENGDFSFYVQPGVYNIAASKTGFTSFQNTVDVVSSKSISITLNSGASLVSGYIYGKKWVGDRQIYVPVAGACVRFMDIATRDTFTCYTDATYGDYRIGLQGSRQYIMQSSATGYAIKDKPCTLSTQSKATLTYNDTISSLAMIAGKIYCSSPSNVLINLVKRFSTAIAATSKSLNNGAFEIRNIADGVYSINVGKDGFVLDSIAGPDTLVVSGGKVMPAQISIYLKPGSKKIKWKITPADFFGSVKLLTPLQKTISTNDSLMNAGPGYYLVNVDAKNDSFIDLASHQFYVGDDAVEYIDTVSMNVIHSRKDTIIPVNGNVVLQLHSSVFLDSATIFYKDAMSSSYKYSSVNKKDTNYLFGIQPPRDGSTMQYYFKAWRKDDVYGYQKEVYKAFIAPDTTVLTKIQIEPLDADTLVLPSSYSMKFNFNCYYSSTYLPFNNLSGQDISWSLTDPQGCAIDSKTGTSVTVTTGNTRTFAVPVTLTATVDTYRIKVIGSNSVSVVFRISGSKLESLQVVRVDGGNSNPVTTSGFDKAEFKVFGKDKSGTALDVVPKWSVLPENAGVISSSGVFKPAKNFCGTVRVFAEVSDLRSEYYSEGSKSPGIQVLHMITHKNSADTASNSRGCTVVFPASVVTNNEVGLLSIETRLLENKIRRGTGLMKTIDSTAFSITEKEGVIFSNTTNDSINLILNIPENLRKEVRSGAREIAIAYWNEDSLQWEPLLNSKVASDGKMICAALSHFSEYSIVIGPARGGYLNIAPNPFSPYVWPRAISPEDKRFGSCISFKVETDRPPLKDVKLRIYTITGEPIWSMHIQNANQFPYQLWWDGRTASKELVWTKPGNIIVEKGEKMCRNGRYFVVLSAKDTNNKEQRFMKQIVLMR
ncbi:MAG TPA: carboxypeptidase-like regulatory domain-containing protein [Chitinispirillaceae bacterium]|nr:carboxypeptidase-like regulatory domain-containing protein [Chitinispirillaceae bacterium]